MLIRLNQAFIRFLKTFLALSVFFLLINIFIGLTEYRSVLSVSDIWLFVLISFFICCCILIPFRALKVFLRFIFVLASFCALPFFLNLPLNDVAQLVTLVSGQLDYDFIIRILIGVVAILISVTSSCKDGTYDVSFPLESYRANLRFFKNFSIFIAFILLTGLVVYFIKAEIIENILLNVSFSLAIYFLVELLLIRVSRDTIYFGIKSINSQFFIAKYVIIGSVISVGSTILLLLRNTLDRLYNDLLDYIKFIFFKIGEYFQNLIAYIAKLFVSEGEIIDPLNPYNPGGSGGENPGGSGGENPGGSGGENPGGSGGGNPGGSGGENPGESGGENPGGSGGGNPGGSGGENPGGSGGENPGGSGGENPGGSGGGNPGGSGGGNPGGSGGGNPGGSGGGNPGGSGGENPGNPSGPGNSENPSKPEEGELEEQEKELDTSTESCAEVNIPWATIGIVGGVLLAGLVVVLVAVWIKNNRFRLSMRKRKNKKDKNLTDEQKNEIETKERQAVSRIIRENYKEFIKMAGKNGIRRYPIDTTESLRLKYKTNIEPNEAIEILTKLYRIVRYDPDANLNYEDAVQTERCIEVLKKSFKGKEKEKNK